MSNDNDDFETRFKKITEEFETNMKKIDEDFAERRAKIEAAMKKQDEESKQRMKEFLQRREQSNIKIEDCQQRIIELQELQKQNMERLEKFAANDPDFNDEVNRIKEALGYTTTDKRKLQ